MSAEDITTLGLSDETHQVLLRMKDEGIIDEMRDGYRLGVALAVARGIVAPEDTKFRTIFNVGSLDQDGLIRDVVSQLYPEASARPYSLVQRLAEAGVAEIGRMHEGGHFRFKELFDFARGDS
jgi:hypothetical protein